MLTRGCLAFIDYGIGLMARAGGFSLSLRGGSRENHVTDLTGTQALTVSSVQQEAFPPSCLLSLVSIKL